MPTNDPDNIDGIPPLPPPPMNTTADGVPPAPSFPGESSSPQQAPSMTRPTPTPMSEGRDRAPEPPPAPAPSSIRWAPNTESTPSEARAPLSGNDVDLLKELVTLMREIRDDLRELKNSPNDGGRLG